MLLAIDVGGTKTLVASFTNKGALVRSIRFATPKDYKVFLGTLKATLLRFSDYNFHYACMAVPGRIDRKRGVVIAFGNLPWRNAPMQRDVKELLACPLVIENDANLAGLSEAIYIKDDHKEVMYLTISTGISTGVIVNGIIDPEFADSEPGHMMLQYGNKMIPWEDFASGRAIKKRYGKLASEINNQKIWKEIAYTFALGINSLIAIAQPEVIVIGGSVGTHFKKYGRLLKAELKKLSTPMTPVPPIMPAHRAEEAVIYGCLEMAKKAYEKSRR